MTDFEEFKEYMKEFKTYSLEDKRKTTLEQLKLIASLANKMCEEVGAKNEMFVTKDILEAEENLNSEEDYVEGVVVYANSIQNSLCDFIDKMTDILKEKAGE